VLCAFVEIYNRFEVFSEENKKAVALALKSYWEAQGKWKKVLKVKSILGD